MALQPPRFPQEFNETTILIDEAREGVGRTSGLREMEDVVDFEVRGTNRRVGGRSDSPSRLQWGLKTETEEHVQKLEDKLARLSLERRSEPTGSTCTFTADGKPPELAEPQLSQLDDRESHSGYLSEDFSNSEYGVEPEGEAAGHDEEGRGLLSISEGSVEASADPDDERELGQEGASEADLSGNEGEQRKTAHPFQHMTAAQRISFSNSVRISGGIHTRPHRHRLPIETFATRRSPSVERSNPHISRDPRPETAPSPLLVASVTASNLNSPSRATSPSGRTSAHPSSSLNVLAPKPRRLSSSSHLSSNFNYIASTYYSASPGSQIPSRGSSPCSSIYAPLQPPSKHTPNPLFVRPAPRLQRQKSGSSGLSFQEYLRDGYDAFEESDDDSDALSRVPKSPGYRELVEQQRRKRLEWEERRRKRIEAKRRKFDAEQESKAGSPGGTGTHSGFWNGVKQLFAVGTHSNANTFGIGSGRAGGSFGSPTVFRAPSRLPASPNYGATNARPSSSPTSTPSTPPQPPPLRPRSILSTSCTPPSGDSPLTGSPAFDPSRLPPPRSRTRSHSRTRSDPPTSRAPPPPPPDKSELDLRFGTSPLRYLSLAFLWYKLEPFFAAVKDLFSTASKGLAKQRERETLLKRHHQRPKPAGILGSSDYQTV